MPILFPAAITGGAQLGFTTPVFNTVADQAPDVNCKQVVVTSVSGTPGVTSHSGSDPFTLTFFRPKQFNVLGRINPTTGQLASIPYNSYKFLARKGVIVLANQPKAPAYFEGTWKIPAGADIADPANLRALASCVIGCMNMQSQGTGDTIITNIVG